MDADGQLMICSDVLGIFQAFTPKFVKRYAELGKEIQSTFEEYAKEVRSDQFPLPEHTYKMVQDELPLLMKKLHK